MKVLFIGGTGIISTAVSELAVKKGMELHLLNRGNRDQLVPEGAKVIHGDINDKAQMEALLKDNHFDAVVDFVIFEPSGIDRDIALFTGKTDHYIFISTCATYQRPVANVPTDETTKQGNPGWDYAEDKIKCEERLIKEYKENGFPMTIVRPSHTYGKISIPFAFSSWNDPWTLIDRIQKSKKIIVPGDGTSLWTLTHNTDFAKGLVGLIGNKEAIGEAFHITSDEVKTWDQYLQLIAKAVGKKPEIIHIASETIVEYFPDQRGGLLGDICTSFILDNSKLKRFVPDYEATMDFETGIKQSIEYFMAHPEKQTVDVELSEKMDQFIGLYEEFLSQIKGTSNESWL